jgi:hypothetical protein
MNIKAIILLTMLTFCGYSHGIIIDTVLIKSNLDLCCSCLCLVVTNEKGDTITIYEEKIPKIEIGINEKYIIGYKSDSVCCCLVDVGEKCNKTIANILLNIRKLKNIKSNNNQNKLNK